MVNNRQSDASKFTKTSKSGLFHPANKPSENDLQKCF